MPKPNTGELNVQELVEEVKYRFSEIINEKEDNVKNNIVSYVLKQLGFNPLKFDYEHSVYNRKQVADIAIKMGNDTYFYVEVKRGDRELTDADIIQIYNYLNTKNIEWGILTNGKEYLLINSWIETQSTHELSLRDKIVFRINLFKNNFNKNFITFLTCESIFVNNKTNYFKDVAQYRAYKHPNDINFTTWKQYRSTLYNFFIFYAAKETRYRNLESVRFDEFLEYLTINPQSKDTYSNKITHIRTFFTVLKKNKKVSYHDFEEDRNKQIVNIEYVESDKDISIYNEENITIILNYIENSKRNKLRNKIIFLTCLYFGLDKSTLLTFEKNMFNFKNSVITIDNRKIKVPRKLMNLYEELFEENYGKDKKLPYLFITKYGDKYRLMEESTINDVFGNFKKIDESDSKWQVFNVQYMRACLIIALFRVGFSIEYIAYHTGSNLQSISAYITRGDIINRFNTSKVIKDPVHPFIKFF